MGSLKSPCRTFYWSSIETITLNCLVFEKTDFVYAFHATDGQTKKLRHRHRVKPPLSLGAAGA